jgi:hypothetical protein
MEKVAGKQQSQIKAALAAKSDFTIFFFTKYFGRT